MEDQQLYTERSVAELISCLYENTQNAQEASKRLTFYQTSPQAWPISVALLLYAAPSTPSEESLNLFRCCAPGLSTFSLANASIVPPGAREVVSFFSAQTLCTLCQAGFDLLCQIFTVEGDSKTQIHRKIRTVLTELIWCYRSCSGSSPTIRQLTQTISACVILTLSGIADENSEQSNVHAVEPLASQMISELLERYGRHTDLFPALLEVLIELPQNIQNKKIAITALQRSKVSYLVLSQTEHVWKSVARVFETISVAPTLSARPRDCQTLCTMNTHALPLRSVALRKLILQCFQTWLEAHCRYHRLRESGQNLSVLPTLPSELQLLRETPAVPIILLNFEAGVHHCLSNGPVFFSPTVPMTSGPNDQLEVDFHSEDSSGWQVVSAAADAIVEVMEFFYSNSVHAASIDLESSSSLALINWTNLETFLAIFGSLCRVNEWLRQFCSRNQKTQKIDVKVIPKAVLRAVTNVLAKFAEVFLPAFVFCIQFEGLDAEELQGAHITAPDPSQRAVILQEVEKLFDMMTEFLSHPSLEFRHLVLDFWFSLIGNQFTQQQAQLESAAAELFALKSQFVLQEDTATGGGGTPALVIPTFETLVSALIRLSMFPSNVAEKPMDFAFEAWVKYRDEVGMALTDTTAIIGCNLIIQKSGSYLLQILKTCIEQPSLPVPWTEIEVYLFALTTVAPRAHAGDDEYIPKALEALPDLPYPEKGTIGAVILNCAAARFILWTAGYIGSQRELFAKCFQLLSLFIPNLMQLTDGLPEVENSVITQPDIHSFLNYCERVMVEALNAIVTAAATMLTRNLNVPETDVTFVLNGLAELAMMSKLSIESRASLIVSAAAVLQCLPKEKMQKYHYRLAQALYKKAIEGLSNCSTVVDTPTSDFLKLFFVSLESVKPVDPIPLPPPSQHAVELERSSEYRHPVLNVMEEFWPLFERCLIEFSKSETVVECVCHCVIRIFSQTQLHAIRYRLFHSFLKSLSTSFVKSPSVFHLGALRSMLGIFGMSNEIPVQKSLNDSLVQCTECVLNAMKESGAHNFVSLSPDIVGMTLDCTNTALNSAVETSGLLAMESFHHCLDLSITLTPDCHHPKVLMTMMLLMMRFVAWLDPLRADAGHAPGLKGRGGDKWISSAKKSSELAERLCLELGLIDKIVKSVIRATTEIFQGNTQWIGIVGSLLAELLGAKNWEEQTRTALQRSLEECPRNIVPLSLVNDILNSLSNDGATNHRFLCSLLQKLADQSEANWQKSQFSVLT